MSCRASQPAIQAHYLNQRRSLMDDWESIITTTTTTETPSDHDTLSTTMHTDDMTLENPTEHVATFFLPYSFTSSCPLHGCRVGSQLNSDHRMM
jgi:hypothetical protein